MKNIELRNLIKEPKLEYRLFYELRIKIQNKKKEIIELQSKFATDKVDQITYKIKSYILEQEKCLLIDLANKELQRLNRKREGHK